MSFFVRPVFEIPERFIYKDGNRRKAAILIEISLNVTSASWNILIDLLNSCCSFQHFPSVQALFTFKKMSWCPWFWTHRIIISSGFFHWMLPSTGTRFGKNCLTSSVRADRHNQWESATFRGERRAKVCLFNLPFSSTQKYSSPRHKSHWLNVYL